MLLSLNKMYPLSLGTPYRLISQGIVLCHPRFAGMHKAADTTVSAIKGLRFAHSGFQF